MACPQLHKPYILLLSSSIIAVDDCRWNVVGFNQLHQQPLPYLRLTPNDLNIIPRPERFWNKASIFNLILTMSNRLSDIYSLRCKKKSGQYNIYRASMTVKYIWDLVRVAGYTFWDTRAIGGKYLGICHWQDILLLWKAMDMGLNFRQEQRREWHAVDIGTE